MSASRKGVNAPLLANADPRDSFDEDERTLLQQEENKQIRRERRRLVLCLGLAIVLTFSALAVTFFVAKRSLGRTRNVIMMVSDGFGPASETYGRTFWQYKLAEDNITLARTDRTPLDAWHVGASRTRSSNSLVTDSAAGATAFSCAMKSYNAAIGVDPKGKPCGTVLEAAKAMGMLTGLVVTSRITHATPAAFSAHVVHRDMENDIASQQIGNYILGRQVDLMFGGGRCEFLPNTTVGSCRTDDRDLLQEATSKDRDEANRWKAPIFTSEELDELCEDPNPWNRLPLMGLFHLDHMNYEIDRRYANKTQGGTTEPALHMMARQAMGILSNSADHQRTGFFLMIEGSRIDMGAHSNDPVAHVHEIQEYYRVVKEVQEFVAQHPDTIVISTSDHETGGFTLGVQNDPHQYPEYLWHPEVIARAKQSTYKLAKQLLTYEPTKGRKEFVRTTILEQGLGITDATEEEVAYLAQANATRSPEEANDVIVFLGHAISKRANLGWTTQGHTGVDVNLYAAGSWIKDRLAGNHENTDIGDVIVQYLDLNLGHITQKLKNNSQGWFKKTREGLSEFVFGGHQHTEHERTGL